jgi:hypothetical protein
VSARNGDDEDVDDEGAEEDGGGSRWVEGFEVENVCE